MAHWGKLLVVMGLASFVLPLLGVQLRIANLFGGGYVGGVVMILAGGALWGIGAALENKGRPADKTPLPQQYRPPEQVSQPQPAGAPIHPPVLTPPPVTGGAARYCAQCRNPLPAQAAFCGICGTPAAMAAPATPAVHYCPGCGASTTGKNFCTQCGRRQV